MKKIKINKFKSLYMFGLGIIGIGVFLVVMFFGFIATVIVDKIQEKERKEILVEKPIIKNVIIHDTIKVSANEIIKETPKAKPPVTKVKNDTVNKDSL